MLGTALLAGVERGLNRLLRLDPTALARLQPLTGRLLEIDCSAPALRLFVLPEGDGLRLALHWEGEADVRLCAPASTLLRLLAHRDKTALLHRPDVQIQGDTALLLALAAVLQDLELDWEHELAGWLGPLGSGLLAGALRGQAGWLRDSSASLEQNLRDYLAEESRALVGQREAEARFAELDELKLALDRLEARIERLAQPLSRPDRP